MGNIKAISHLETIKLLKEKYGQPAVEKVKAALSAPDREALYNSTILPIAWLDLSLILRDCQAIDRTLGKGDWTFLHELLGEVAQRQFNGIYRFFLALVNPQTVFKKSGQIWRQFHDQGQLVGERTGTNSAILRLTDFPGLPVDHEHIFLPYLVKILELTGAKNVSVVHRACLARKDPECITEITWS